MQIGIRQSVPSKETARQLLSKIEGIKYLEAVRSALGTEAVDLPPKMSEGEELKLLNCLVCCCQARVSRCLRWFSEGRRDPQPEGAEEPNGGYVDRKPFTCGAICVLQAEAGLMPFSYLGAIESEEVVVGEDLDAVVVPAKGKRVRQGPLWRSWQRSALLPLQPKVSGTHRPLTCHPLQAPGHSCAHHLGVVR